jgi:multiple antibiotic resistance protein
LTLLDPFLSELLKGAIALFIVVDPTGLVPVILGMTGDMDQNARKRILNTALLTSFILLIVFALIGQQLLGLFGITVNSFKIAGGILLLLLAMQMLIKGQFIERSSTQTDDIGVVPIAIPLLVGPGAITTTIVTIQSSGVVVTILSIGIVMLSTWLIFRYIERINSLLGKRGSAVLTMLIAIFIAAIGVQFILSGVLSYFPAT